MSKTNYRIRVDEYTKRTYLQMFCISCHRENIFYYDDLEKDYGPNPHWLRYKKIPCQHCGQEMEFGDY